MKILNLIVASMLLSVSSLSFANINNLSKTSSWDEIRNTPNIDIEGDDVLVGNLRTTVFDVELKDGKLHTKEPTQNGYYDLRYGVGSEQGSPYIKTDKTIKTGDVVINIPIYNYKRMGSEQGVVGEVVSFKEYEQPLKRTLKVYKARELGQQGNHTRTFLFEKEYEVQ